MLLLLFTAAVWWLANLFTLVMRGERLRGERDRGEEVFDWLDVRGGFLYLREGGIFSLLIYLSKNGGVFIAFRAAQPSTVEHSNAQSCTVDAQSSAAMHSHAQSMHSRAQQCTIDAQSSAAMHSRAGSNPEMP